MNTRSLYNEVSKLMNNNTRLAYTITYKVMKHHYGFDPYSLPKEESQSIVKSLKKTKHYKSFKKIILTIAWHYHFQGYHNETSIENEWKHWNEYFKRNKPWIESKPTIQKSSSYQANWKDEMENWNRKLSDAYLTDNPQAWNNLWF